MTDKGGIKELMRGVIYPYIYGHILGLRQQLIGAVL